VDPDLHATATTLLRRAGQRYTGGRRDLVQVLADSGGPLTIPGILERRRDIAQSSAYRNLAVLETAGVVRRVVTNGEYAWYELAEQLTGHHHHLVCSACGTVSDFTVPAALERTLDRELTKVADGADFAIGHHSLDLVGVCASCR
jgi:Fur family transcriptional regulator, ferric uptake regulator